ncbi:MAG TPA: hypothetical protein VG738_18990 [Chitinophagaceae bacterium]|nr:hypothetical protein [Chitinophagaceae bacterium]
MRPFNPLIPFIPKLIPALEGIGQRYLVAQTYTRGENPFEETKQPLLLCDYDNLNKAKDHRQAIEGDKWAAIIDLQHGPHRLKLEEMTRADSAYVLYAAFVKDKKQTNARTDKYLAESVRQYISRETAWSPSRGEKVDAILELQYGKLYLQLKYAGERVKQNLSVFEELLRTAAVAAPARTPPEEYRIIFQTALPSLA